MTGSRPPGEAAAPSADIRTGRPGGPAHVAARAAVLQRLELDVTRRLDGLLSGDHLAAAAGPGSEPAGARPYGPGDDARRSDWSLSARSLIPHVRTTEADRELETWIVVDRSPSLDFGTALREKRDVALAAVAGFGFLSLRSGNRLGAMIAGTRRITHIPARPGRHHVFALLTRVYDTPREDVGPSADAGLGAALARLEKVQRRRGQVVVVSDFLEPEGWAVGLRRLSLRHQVVAVHITDPRELALPPVGMLGLVDPETGRRLHVQSNSSRLRERFATAAEERRGSIRGTIIASGGEYLGLDTERDWLVDLARFVSSRKAARRRWARVEPVGAGS